MVNGSTTSQICPANQVQTAFDSYCHHICHGRNIPKKRWPSNHCWGFLKLNIKTTVHVGMEYVYPMFEHVNLKQAMNQGRFALHMTLGPPAMYCHAKGDPDPREGNQPSSNSVIPRYTVSCINMYKPLVWSLFHFPFICAMVNLHGRNGGMSSHQ